MEDFINNLELGLDPPYWSTIRLDGKFRCVCGNVFDPGLEGGIVSSTLRASPICDKCIRKFFDEDEDPLTEAMHYESYMDSKSVLSGLARKCPKCNVIGHYDNVRGRKPVEVTCQCGHAFTVHRYKKGERPQ